MSAGAYVRSSELTRTATAKPLPGSGRSERKKKRISAKQMQEPETHAQQMERVEFWRTLRLELFARDGGRCRACGVGLDIDAGLAANALNCHHILHRSRGGKDEPLNLICLCAKCHRKHHDGLLAINGAASYIAFTAYNRKGVITKSWESAL